VAGDDHGALAGVEDPAGLRVDFDRDVRRQLARAEETGDPRRLEERPRERPVRAAGDALPLLLGELGQRLPEVPVGPFPVATVSDLS
jgi:hypothetical protein